MINLFQYSFFYNAIIISLILSLLFSLMSFIIVTKRLSFLAIGTEHAAFGGMGLAHVLNIDPFLTTSVFCAGLTVYAGRSHSKSSDMGISLLFSGAMAFGMLLLSLNNKAPFNLMGFLFGDMLGVGIREIIIAGVVTLLILVLFIPSLSKVLFIVFDRDMAKISGINIQFWDILIYVTLSFSIVLGINAVGVLLVSALSVLPAAFALLFKKNVYQTLLIAFLFSLLIMMLGIVGSFYFDVAPGSLIVIMAVIVYFIVRTCLKNKF